MDQQTFKRSSAPLPFLADENDFDNVLGQLLPEEREFFRFLDAQLDMINNFYRGKTEDV